MELLRPPCCWRKHKSLHNIGAWPYSWASPVSGDTGGNSFSVRDLVFWEKMSREAEEIQGRSIWFSYKGSEAETVTWVIVAVTGECGNRMWVSLFWLKFSSIFSFISYNFIQLLSSSSPRTGKWKGKWWRPVLPLKSSRQQDWWKFPAPSIYGRVLSVACVCYLDKGALELEGRSSPRSCWLLKPDVLFLIRLVYDRFHKCFMRPWWLHGWAGWWQLPPTSCVIDKRSKTRFTTLIRSDG